MTRPFDKDHPEQIAYNSTCSMWLTEGTNDHEKYAYRDGHHAGWLNATKESGDGELARQAYAAGRAAADEIDRLRQVARNVYEVWAGSDGIPMPETAAEAYLLHLVEQMRDEAKNGLPNAI